MRENNNEALGGGLIFYFTFYLFFWRGGCVVRTHPTHPLPIRACHLSTAARRCSGFAAVGPAGRRYRSIAAAAGRRSSTAARRSKTNASSAMLSADVGSSRTDLFVRMRNVNERVISVRQRRATAMPRFCCCSVSSLAIISSHRQ